MEAPDLGPGWAWKLLVIMAGVGALATVAAIVYGVIWAIGKINIG